MTGFGHKRFGTASDSYKKFISAKISTFSFSGAQAHLILIHVIDLLINQSNDSSKSWMCGLLVD